MFRAFLAILALVLIVLAAANLIPGAYAWTEQFVPLTNDQVQLMFTMFALFAILGIGAWAVGGAGDG